MKRASIVLTTALTFLLVEGCYLGNAARRAITGEPPEPGLDGADPGAKEALYVTVYAVIRELAGFAAGYFKERAANKGTKPPTPGV